MRRLATLKTDTEVAKLDYLDLVDLRPLWNRLCSMPRLHSLNLSGNKLSSLPADMSQLRTLTTLDITQNMFPTLTAILPGLRSLPVLAELFITVTEQEEELLLVSLPRLRSLNGVALDGSSQAPADGAQPVPQQQQPPLPQQQQQRPGPAQSHPNNPPAQARRTDTISLTKQDLAELQTLFSAVKNLRNNLSQEHSQHMTTAFEQHVQAVVLRLQERLKSITDSTQRQTEILMAKHGLYDMCFQEAMVYSQTIDPQLRDVLDQICGVHSTLFQQAEGLLTDAVVDRVQLQRDVEHAEGETNQLLEAAEKLEQEAGAHHNELVALRNEVRRLQTENEQLRGLPGAAKALRALGGDSTSPSAANGPRRAQQANGVGNGSTTSPPPGPPPVPPAANAQGKFVVQDANGASFTLRALTLKQLKDFIDQIQASKEKYDTKCKELGLPRETMEMHTYSYLNNRFGLKQIIVETAASIIKGLDKYKMEDNDVAVFAKVFRNEIDEEFHRVQRQIKDTVVDLLRIHLKGKMRLKGDDVITEQLREKMAGLLTEDEWSNIVKYMYNAEDSATLSNLIHDSAHDELVQAGPAASERPTDAISYQGLVRLLLDFQLRGHDRFLMRFRSLFRACDTDSDGVLTDDQFRTLALKVSPSRDDSEVLALLETVDPANTKRVTFSDAVGVLSPDIVDLMITVARAVNPAHADEVSSTRS